MNLLVSKQQILSQYKRYFDLLKIGSRSTTDDIKKHFQAVHVYLRILEYYSNIPEGQDVYISEMGVEGIRLELEKSIYLLATKYYV